MTDWVPALWWYQSPFPPLFDRTCVPTYIHHSTMATLVPRYFQSSPSSKHCHRLQTRNIDLESLSFWKYSRGPVLESSFTITTLAACLLLLSPLILTVDLEATLGPPTSQGHFLRHGPQHWEERIDVFSPQHRILLSAPRFSVSACTLHHIIGMY